MTLNEQLAGLRTQIRAALSGDDVHVLDDSLERLRMLQLAEQGLQPGEPFPDFALPDTEGRLATSGELLDRGPLVVAFYRGGWCPYCDTMLRALETARPAIEAAGATLVAVSADRPEAQARTRAEKGLGFPLLTDIGGALARLCGVQFELSDAHVAFYRRAGIDLPACHAETGWELPLPATYVVGQDGNVAYVFVDADWTRRAEPADVVAAVCGLAQAAEAGSSGGACARRGFSASSTNARTGGE
jgi:peroxiredoxin